MAFRIGLVGLCTSHPGAWVPIIRELAQADKVDVEVAAAWDSAETRPQGFAGEFCREHDIPRAVDKLDDMLELVDGVIVHTTNWDRHLQQARPFVDAGKPVLLDKPVVGNLRDARAVLDWIAQGKRVTGGSSMRFTAEVAAFLARPVEERGRVHTAFVPCCTDEFNYAIHGYALACSLMGPGVVSAQYLGCSGQKLVRLDWSGGRAVVMTVGRAPWFASNLTAVTDQGCHYLEVDTGGIYRGLLEAQLPYLAGVAEEPPLAADTFLEPELAALAARASWQRDGDRVFLDDLRLDDPGYDGDRFAAEYRRQRLGA